MDLITVRHYWDFGPIPPEVDNWADDYFKKNNPGPCPRTIQCEDPTEPEVTRHIFNDHDYTEDFRMPGYIVITDNHTGEVEVISFK